MNTTDKKSYLTRLLAAAGLITAGAALRVISKNYLILGNMSLGAGAAVLAFCAVKAIKTRYPKIAAWTEKLLTYGVILFCFAFAVTEGAVVYGYQTGDEELDEMGIDAIEADYLIVLGAGVEGSSPSDLLQLRLEAALEYLNLHPDTVCIVSGGYTTSDEMSEAECMANWLAQNGISPERIVKEDRAQDTYQNIKFSYEIIEAEKPDAAVAVVTGDYHVLRAKVMAKVQGYDPAMIGAQTRGVLVRVNYYAREVFALWNRLVFGYETA